MKSTRSSCMCGGRAGDRELIARCATAFPAEVTPSTFLVDGPARGCRPTRTTEGSVMATATDLSPIETARALQPLVREHADQAEAQGYVSEVVVRALAEAGLYRLCAPAAF